MAALMPRQEDIDHIGDITSNLNSLQFESALSNSELQYLHLRKKSHALTVTACAQAVYFVSMMNEAREVKAQLRNPKQRRASRLLQESSSKDPLLIGIIGCGRLGTHLAHALLSFGQVNPEELKISTRRPETQAELQEKGVLCIHDNAQVAASVHLLFLCVLPCQFPALADEIKGKISPRCTIYSMISTTSTTRLKQLLDYSNILRPEYHFNKEDVEWNNKVDIPTLLADSAVVEMTCPFSFNKKDSVVITEEKFGEQMVLAFINMCSMLRLNVTETMNVVHAVLFGETQEEPLTEKLEPKDILVDISQNFRHFPQMDLVSMLSREIPLLWKIGRNNALRTAFVDRYCLVFSQYLQWKQFVLEQSR